MKWNDVFISLPIAFGKTLCYILIPRVFDVLRNVGESSLMLVTLMALMEKQVAYAKSLGISAVYVGTITSMATTLLDTSQWRVFVSN